MNDISEKGSRASTASLVGYRVRSDVLPDCVDDIVKSIGQRRRRWLACLNPHSYVVARRRPRFRSALVADWLVPDGSGIMLASWILGAGIKMRITGPDVFYALHDRLQKSGGYSVFFLGSSENILAEIEQRMARVWPDIEVVGTYSPPFKSEFSDQDIDDRVNLINWVRPDVLWVGMTAPKQEGWIYRVLPRLDVGFAAAVGAIFDFYAGKVKRAHPLLGHLGIEWLPRLLREPRRLWRRTLITAPIFLWYVLLARFGLLRPVKG